MPNSSLVAVTPHTQHLFTPRYKALLLGSLLILTEAKENLDMEGKG